MVTFVSLLVMKLNMQIIHNRLFISLPHYKSYFKVHLTSKYIFFRLNKSLHLLERHCVFFKLNVDYLQAVKVTKSSHHLSHYRASKGHGSIPRLTSKADLHCIKSL